MEHSKSFANLGRFFTSLRSNHEPESLPTPKKKAEKFSYGMRSFSAFNLPSINTSFSDVSEPKRKKDQKTSIRRKAVNSGPRTTSSVESTPSQSAQVFDSPTSQTSSFQSLDLARPQQPSNHAQPIYTTPLAPPPTTRPPVPQFRDTAEPSRPDLPPLRAPPTPYAESHSRNSSTGRAGQRSSSSPATQKLHKEQPAEYRQNRQSPDVSPSSSPRLSPLIRGRNRGPGGDGISSTTLSPSASVGDIQKYRAVSSPNSRPLSYISDGGSSDGKLNNRRSWMPGRKSRSNSYTNPISGPAAWIVPGKNVEYNVTLLSEAQKVPELWDDNGDVFVYLFPAATGRSPSFRISSEFISASQPLMTSAFAKSRSRARSFDGRGSLSVEDATRNLHMRDRYSPPSPPALSPDLADSEALKSRGPRQGHLYFPPRAIMAALSPEQIEREDLEYLISIRNLFAFLTGQPLVATRRHPTIFSIFVLIAGHLQRAGFSNPDGSTFGEAASISLSFYVEDFGLADVRLSREKTIEGVVLGERMRSVELYNEAFAHAVGKYHALKSMTDYFDMISIPTKNRIERAYIDLENRQRSVNYRLEEFDFPALFAGFAASTTSEESKFVRFKAWKSSFSTMRKHVMSHYKGMYGSWPPRASNKKNNFEESGLNRLVLKLLYHDLCTLYDLLVDRQNRSTRSMDADGPDSGDPTITALRHLLSESDHSSPPVQPPMPFDAPILPSLTALSEIHNELPEQTRQKAELRKLKDTETALLLARSHNNDYPPTDFMKSFLALEAKEARGKNVKELGEQRLGYWLFIYVVLQSLPLLVVDAPGLRHTEAVEYLLCSPPKGGVPWMEDFNTVKRAWYGVSGGKQLINLPSDLVDYGVEGVYARSHPWIMAEKWIAGDNSVDPDLESIISPLEPPPDLYDFPTERGSVPHNNISHGSERLSVSGLAQISDNNNHRGSYTNTTTALPVSRPTYVRHGSTPDSVGEGKSFDEILSGIPGGKPKHPARPKSRLW